MDPRVIAPRVHILPGPFSIWHLWLAAQQLRKTKTVQWNDDFPEITQAWAAGNRVQVGMLTDRWDYNGTESP